MEIFSLLLFIGVIYSFYLSALSILQAFDGFESRSNTAIEYLFNSLFSWSNAISLFFLCLLIIGIIETIKRTKREKEKKEEQEKYERELIRIEKEKEEKEIRAKQREETRKKKEIEQFEKEKKIKDKKAITEIKRKGYIEDRFINQIFDFIRRYGLRREYFKPNEDLKCERLDLRVEAEKNEVKLSKAIDKFNLVYSINEDNKIFNSFLREDLENSMIQNARSGTSFPMYYDPFKIIDQNKGIYKERWDLDSFASVCHDLGFIEEPFFSRNIKPVFENYFDNKDFKKIVDTYKKRGINLTWGFYKHEWGGDDTFKPRIIINKINR